MLPDNFGHLIKVEESFHFCPKLKYIFKISVEQIESNVRFYLYLDSLGTYFKKAF
jgi:hypothetical protein